MVAEYYFRSAANTDRGLCVIMRDNTDIPLKGRRVSPVYFRFADFNPIIFSMCAFSYFAQAYIKWH